MQELWKMWKIRNQARPTRTGETPVPRESFLRMSKKSPGIKPGHCDTCSD